MRSGCVEGRFGGKIATAVFAQSGARCDSLAVAVVRQRRQKHQSPGSPRAHLDRVQRLELGSRRLGVGEDDVAHFVRVGHRAEGHLRARERAGGSRAQTRTPSTNQRDSRAMPRSLSAGSIWRHSSNVCSEHRRTSVLSPSLTVRGSSRRRQACSTASICARSLSIWPRR